MATNIKTIEGHLTAAGIKFVVNDEKQHIKTGFRLSGYRSPDGDPLLIAVIGVEEDGEFIRFVSPFCYVCKNQEHFDAVTQVCNEANRALNMIRVEFDPADGEVRLAVDLPLEDAVLTQRQLIRSLMSLPSAVERFDEMFRAAVETGEVISPEDPEEFRAALEEFMRARRAQRRTPARVGLEE